MSQGPRDEAVIQTPDRRLRVFVSSTLGELAEERRAVSRAISALRLTPVMFEAGARPYPPAEVYRAYLAQSDVFIGLYWQRYGQLVPGAQVSGLEEEFQLSGGLPRLLYVKAPAPDREPRLADLLARIREESSASYRYFRTPAELGRLVRDDLAVLLSERFAAVAGQAAAPSPSSAAGRGPGRLPVSVTSLLGRERAIDEVAGLVERSGVRLVTLTGPGGVGKTRLAVAAGERLRDRFGAGMVFVPLEAVTDPGLVLAAVGRAAGADLARTGSPVQALAETFGDGAWLLILDNLEQVVQVARDLGELLARCPGLAMLATSRTVLGLRAEREYPVPPLPLPAGPGTASVAEVAASPAAALFVDRARAVRPGFALTEGNAAAVAQICQRLEGLPLAIELAAARTRLLEPAVLLDRLAASLDALGTGAVDLPARQRTLRATVEWSVGLLSDAERSLLEVAAVFADGWTVPAAASVAGLEEDRALELTEELARHSLVYVHSTELGPRTRMLETVREFVAEHLEARPDAAEAGRRHAGYYKAQAEQADRPLRTAGRNQWLERLQAEAGDLAAAVRWYLAHDPGPLPHLFRVLWPFWSRWDLERQARPWVEQLLPAAGTLDPQARAELAWTAAVIAVDPVTTRRRWRAASAWRRCWPGSRTRSCTPCRSWPWRGACRSPATSSRPCGKRRSRWRSSAARMSPSSRPWPRSPPAPWTRRWAATTTPWATWSRRAAWRSGAAVTGSPRAPACSLGIPGLLRGRLDEARMLLEEALDLSLAARSTPFVTMCLAAYARLAFAEGDPEQAARLEGAAEGLRRRVGLPGAPFPSLQPSFQCRRRRVAVLRPFPATPR